MGAGNKLDPTAFKVADISKTAVCPLAKAVRVALRKKGINRLKVVYSEEQPFIPQKNTQDTREAETINELSSSKSPDAKENYDRRTPPGSLSFVPSVMGLILAGEVIKDISFSEQGHIDPVPFINN